MRTLTQRWILAIALIAAISAFGCSQKKDEAATPPLRIAAQLKQFTIAEVCEYSEAPDDHVRQRIAGSIAHAERLCLISIAGNKLEFDPIAAGILLNSTATA